MRRRTADASLDAPPSAGGGAPDGGARRGGGIVVGSPSVYVNSESNVVTQDLIEYLRAEGVNAQGFVYTGEASVVEVSS